MSTSSASSVPSAPPLFVPEMIEEAVGFPIEQMSTSSTPSAHTLFTPEVMDKLHEKPKQGTVGAFSDDTQKGFGKNTQ